MKRTLAGLTTPIAIAVALVAGPALAHHSGAMFDRAKTLTLKGTLLEYQFVAPHAWISLLVPSAEDATKMVRWDIEGGTASRMKAQGVTPERLRPGDKITIRAHPLRDGRHGGGLIDITLADGVLISNNPTKLQVGQ